jgi:arabinofuranosyltransferase
MSRRANLIAALVLPALLISVMAWQRRWLAEDSFIDLRVVANLSAGRGPVFNPDERVEVYTDPLRVFLVFALGKPLERLGVRIEWTSILIDVVAAALGLVVAGAAAAKRQRRRGEPWLWAPLGALCVALLPPYWDFATVSRSCGWESRTTPCRRTRGGAPPSSLGSARSFIRIS